MDRAEYLKICKRCSNRKYDLNKGIVCGLTNEIANFDANCSEYKADPEAIKKEDALDLAQQNTPEAKTRELKKKIEEAKSQIDPKKAVKKSANWFYWIAGLSLLNSMSILMDSNFGFSFGLGFTQLFDGFLIGISGGYNVWSLIPSIVFSAIFVLIGYYANNYSKVAFIVGMAIYSIDTILFLMVPDYLSIGLHVFALIMIYNGYKFLKAVHLEDNSVAKKTE